VKGPLVVSRVGREGAPASAFTRHVPVFTSDNSTSPSAIHNDRARYILISELGLPAHALCLVTTDMQRLRNQRARPQPPNTITVEVTVEVNRQEIGSSFHDTDCPAIPPYSILPIRHPGDTRRPQVHRPAQLLSMQEPASRTLAEAAIRFAVQSAEDDARDLSMHSTPRAYPGYVHIPMEDVTSIIWNDISNLLKPGQQLADMERQRQQIQETIADRNEVDRPIEELIEDFLFLSVVDQPLFHMMRDALDANIPQQIFLRWDALRTRMRHTGKTLAVLVRQAEETTRDRWSSIIVELYFLLLEYVTSPFLDHDHRKLTNELT
jgi:hypothetical protein